MSANIILVGKKVTVTNTLAYGGAAVAQRYSEGKLKKLKKIKDLRFATQPRAKLKKHASLLQRGVNYGGKKLVASARKALTILYRERLSKIN